MAMVSKHVPMEAALWKRASDAAKARGRRLSELTGSKVRISASEFIRSAIETEIALEEQQQQPAETTT